MFTRNPTGFTMQFPNGYEVSVQWSKGHNCSLKSRGIHSDVSNTAEVVVFRGCECLSEEGYVPAEKVAAILAEVASRTPQRKIDIGGLLRCCVLFITEHYRGKAEEGEVVHCSFCQGRVKVENGVWKWDNSPLPEGE